MDREQAKEILRLYRPGIGEQDGPEMTEALEFARRDPELGRWFADYCAVQEAIRAKFRATAVPEGLKEQIISERKAALRSRSQKRVLALALVIVLGLIWLPKLLHSPNTIAEDTSFKGFRQWTTLLVLRYPKMDLETNNIAAIRQVVQKTEGKYTLPPALETTTPTGCATNVGAWGGTHPVAMICFHSGKTSNPSEPDLFLFMTDRTALPDPPQTSSVQFAKVGQLTTASWSDANKTYVLGVRGTEEDLKRYF